MRSASVALALAVAGCGSTGGALVTFHAAAAGPADAVAGQPLVFTTQAFGYQVTLTRARLHVGALYVNRAVPLSGSQAQACILPGIFSGQVTTPLDVDALSPAPQPFPSLGEGTADESFTGQIWIFGSNVDANADPTVLVDVEGTAAKDGTTYPFTGQLTISSNREPPVTNPTAPGAFPLCKLRIITPIPIDLTPAQGGTLILRVDPRIWFDNVDFAQVPLAGDASNPGLRRFVDSSQSNPDLLTGVRSTNAYTFSWQAP
jgi:hypothetical protein